MRTPTWVITPAPATSSSTTTPPTSPSCQPGATSLQHLQRRRPRPGRNHRRAQYPDGRQGQHHQYRRGGARGSASWGEPGAASRRGPQWRGLRALRQGLPGPGQPGFGRCALANQDGKVAKTYEAELVDWLKERFGFSGDTEQARNFFAALPAERQRVFARRRVLCRAQGRWSGVQRSRRRAPGQLPARAEAIDLLFPSKDVAGNAITYKGDITMFGGAGVAPISAAVSKCSPRAAGKHSASRAMRRRPPPG